MSTKKKAAKKAATKSAKKLTKPPVKAAKKSAKKQATPTKKEYKVLFYNTLLTKTKNVKLADPKVGDVLYYNETRAVVTSINGHSIGALLDPTEDRKGRVIL